MQKEYKKLLFDLDNTLVDDDENRKYAIKKILLEKVGTASDNELDRFIKLDNQFWTDRAEGKIKDPYEFKTNEEKTEWIRAQRFINYFEDITLEEAVKISNKYIDILKEHIVPIKNAKEVLQYLYEKGYEIYIVTNSPTRVVKDKLSKINVDKYIKDTFSAEEAGHMKPHNMFFKGFFDKINSHEKENMLIIGDELEKDIQGGIKEGIDTCWFNIKNIDNDTNFKPVYEIKELIELKDIL